MNCIFTDAKREKAKNTFKKCISPPRSNVSDPAGCSFSRVFFYLELWAMRKTRFLLIQSLSLWHDPIFCWTFGIFFLFCLQQRNYNREIKLHLHIESNICWTLLVCACMSVLSTHKNAFEIAKKFYSVFFTNTLFSWFRSYTRWPHSYATDLCYKFPRVNSFTFSIRLFRSRFLLDALCLFWAFSFTFIHSIGRRFAQMCIEIWCSRCLNFDSRLVPLFFLFLLILLLCFASPLDSVSVFLCRCARVCVSSLVFILIHLLHADAVDEHTTEIYTRNITSKKISHTHVHIYIQNRTQQIWNDAIVFHLHFIWYNFAWSRSFARYFLQSRAFATACINWTVWFYSVVQICDQTVRDEPQKKGECILNKNVVDSSYSDSGYKFNGKWRYNIQTCLAI